jgi:hypothetical protein
MIAKLFIYQFTYVPTYLHMYLGIYLHTYVLNDTNSGCLAGIGKLPALGGWYFGWYFWCCVLMSWQELLF